MTGAAREWTLDIPRPDEWISANHREHHMVRAAKTKAWRQAAQAHARAARIPALTRATVLAEGCAATNHRRDVDRIALTVKACLDGLTDAGIWPDDNHEHVTQVTYREGPRVTGLARLRLTITEVTP